MTAGRQDRRPVRAAARLALARFRWALGVVVKPRRLALAVRIHNNGNARDDHEQRAGAR